MFYSLYLDHSMKNYASMWLIFVCNNFPWTRVEEGVSFLRQRPDSYRENEKPCLEFCLMFAERGGDQRKPPQPDKHCKIKAGLKRKRDTAPNKTF